jgi:hypothetical protein
LTDQAAAFGRYGGAPSRVAETARPASGRAAQPSAASDAHLDRSHGFLNRHARLLSVGRPGALRPACRAFGGGLYELRWAAARSDPATGSQPDPGGEGPGMRTAAGPGGGAAPSVAPPPPFEPPADRSYTFSPAQPAASRRSLRHATPGTLVGSRAIGGIHFFQGAARLGEPARLGWMLWAATPRPGVPLLIELVEVVAERLGARGVAPRLRWHARPQRRTIAVRRAGR